MTQSKTFKVLQILRAVAALMVVVTHSFNLIKINLPENFTESSASSFLLLPFAEQYAYCLLIG